MSTDIFGFNFGENDLLKVVQKIAEHNLKWPKVIIIIVPELTYIRKLVASG